MSSLKITLKVSDLASRLRPHMRAVNEVFADEARRLCPVDSGELRDSITATEGGFGATAPYAALVELGTSKTAAQPFLRPALDSVRQPALSQLEGAL